MAACGGSPNMTRKAKIFACVLLIVNVITAITVICLISSKRTLSSPVTIKWKDFEQSLGKVYLALCVNLQLVVKNSKRARAAPSLEFLSLLKPVVHLAGLDFDQTVIKNAETSAVRNWALSEGSERTSMYNGMDYENGSIIVPATGVYFVYSHVKFYVEDNMKDKKQTIFHHGIFRYNAVNKTEEDILLNKVTECKEGINEGAHLEYPSGIRGVVYLNGGDRLSVKVSSLNLLKHDRDWHYFGVYLV